MTAALNNIPGALTDGKYFVLWGTVQRDGKAAKVPFRIDGRRARQ
jgi:primase-polymerase (primpol)-like protein